MKTSARYRLCIVSMALFLLTTNAQTPGKPSLVGKWKLNVTKSQLNNLPRPTQSMFVVSEATASRFKWEARLIFADGQNITGFDGAIDGKPYPYKGAGRGAQMSFVDDNGVLTGTATYPSGERVLQTIDVSPDGSTMTAQCKLESSSGQTFWTEVWERVPDKKRR